MKTKIFGWDIKVFRTTLHYEYYGFNRFDYHFFKQQNGKKGLLIILWWIQINITKEPDGHTIKE